MPNLNNENNKFNNIGNNINENDYTGPILADIRKILPSIRDNNLKLSLGFFQNSQEGVILFSDEEIFSILHYCAVRVLNKYFNLGNENTSNWVETEELSTEELRTRGEQIFKKFRYL